MELVFATHNQHKVEEVKGLLPPSIRLLSLNDIGCREEIPETADTLEGNASLKAAYVLKNYGVSCFADDTGLEVRALNGAPGVYSARYAGEPKNDTKNLQKLLQNMQSQEDRRAQFTTVITLATEKELTHFKGDVQGLITLKPRGSHGFGYDPIFQPLGYAETFAELPLSTKNKISHRARAFEQLMAHFRQVQQAAK